MKRADIQCLMKQGIALFNDALNTLYLRLYDVWHNGIKALRCHVLEIVRFGFYV